MDIVKFRQGLKSASFSTASTKSAVFDDAPDFDRYTADKNLTDEEFREAHEKFYPGLLKMADSGSVRS